MAQSKINTHGYKMKGLREICSMTKGIRKNSNYYLEIAWNESTGKILIEEHVGSIGNQWVEWKPGNIPCGYITRPKTQQELADSIATAIELHKLLNKEGG